MKTLFPYSAAIAVLLTISGNAWTQQAAAGTDTGSSVPNVDKPPMQAQDLARLVPRDSSEPPTVDISEKSANSYYRYDKRGVNCSLYPARCRGEDY